MRRGMCCRVALLLSRAAEVSLCEYQLFSVLQTLLSAQGKKKPSGTDKTSICVAWMLCSCIGSSQANNVLTGKKTTTWKVMLSWEAQYQAHWIIRDVGSVYKLASVRVMLFWGLIFNPARLMEEMHYEFKITVMGVRHAISKAYCSYSLMQ